MADYAAEIYVLRRDYIKRLKGYLNDTMLKISEGKEELFVLYKSNIDEDCELSEKSLIKEKYKRILTENIDREKCAGVSLFGPHRDDIEFLINGKSARLYASQGQQRSVVLALKLAEGEVNREIWGDYPVYLFDDVLSELDEKRRAFVTSGVLDKQIIITTCEREKADFKDAKVIEVVGGSYVSSCR
jgi:DNA replication and repair protein RecF